MGYTKVGPSPIVNFTSEYAKPLVSLKTNIVAQGGGGTPTTPIPIVGWNSVNVTCADEDMQTVDTFTLPLGQTIYGGYVDWENGKLVVTHLYVKMANLTWIGSNGIFENRTNYEDLHTAVRGSYTRCDIYDSSGSTSSANMRDKTIQTMGGSGSSNFWVKDLDYSTAQDFIDSLGNHEIVYQLATPIEISLPTTMPQTIQGVQNWFADSGDIELCYTSFIEYHKVASIFVTPNSNVQIESAEGAIANFTTPLAMPLVALKAYIQAQGGGGTPTTPIPIVGVSEVNVTRAGKNLVSGILTGQAIGSAGNIFADESYNIAYAPIKKGADYIITSDNGVWAYFTSIPENGSVSYDGLRTIDANRKFTAPINGYVAFRSSSSYTTPQIEAGLTPSSYESPITPTIFTLSLGQTIYGGYVDWENGKLYLTSVKSLIKDLPFVFDSYQNAVATVTNMPAGVSGVKPDVLAEVFETIIYNDRTSYSNAIITLINNQNAIYIRNHGASDIPDFINTYGDEIIVYPLETPIEIDLPTTMPNTIQGVQNWFADSGDIELEYKKIIT